MKVRTNYIKKDTLNHGNDIESLAAILVEAGEARFCNGIFYLNNDEQRARA